MSWTPQNCVNNVSTGFLGTDKNVFHAFVANSTNQLVRSGGTDSKWYNLNKMVDPLNVGVIPVGVAADAFAVYCFVRGCTYGHLALTTLGSDGTVPNPPGVLFDLGRPNNDVTKKVIGPVGTAVLGPFVYCFVNVDDGHLWANWRSVCNPASPISSPSVWSWTDLGVPSGVTVVNGIGATACGQQLLVYIQGSDGNLWVNMWQNNTWLWVNLNQTPHAPTVIGPVGVFTNGIYNSAYIQGSDNHLWLNVTANGITSWTDLGVPKTGVTLARGVGVVPFLFQIWAFVIGSDGHLWVNWSQTGATSWVDLGVPATGVTVVGSVGAICPTGTPYAFVGGSDGQLWACSYLSATNTWHWIPLGQPTA